MIWINVFFLLLFTLIQFIPLNLKLKISYDVLKNKGELVIALFKLKLLNLNLSIHQGYIEVMFKKSKKIKLLPIEFSKESGFFSDTDIVSILIKKMKIQQGTTYINFGVKTDAFLTAMVIGTSKVLTSVLGSIIKSKKTESKIKNKIYPSFNKDKLIICFKASIKLSIVQIITSFIQALIAKINVNKEIKNER